jgi:hypothetical protein
VGEGATLSWVGDLSADRYPGVVRREIAVESFVRGRHLVFDAVLRDRWLDHATGEEEEIHGYHLELITEPPLLTIVAAHATPGHLPFPECPAAAASVQGLVGLSLLNGFNKAAADVLRGVDGCTHLLSMAQTISGQRVVGNYLRSRVDEESTPESRARREAMLGVCSGWREGGVAIELSRRGQSLGRSQVHQPTQTIPEGGS